MKGINFSLRNISKWKKVGFLYHSNNNYNSKMKKKLCNKNFLLVTCNQRLLWNISLSTQILKLTFIFLQQFVSLTIFHVFV